MHCLFIFHKWRPVAVSHYDDTSWSAVAPSTTVTLQCVHCGSIKSVDVYGGGYLSLDDLQEMYHDN